MPIGRKGIKLSSSPSHNDKENQQREGDLISSHSQSNKGHEMMGRIRGYNLSLILKITRVMACGQREGGLSSLVSKVTRVKSC